MSFTPETLKDFLEEKYLLYNRPSFIEQDPISIPHLFSRKEDIEISAFLTATISWGQRPSILKNAHRLMELMDMAPHDFIMNAKSDDTKRFRQFVHRTFNGIDCIYFLKSLQNIYQKHQGLEKVFQSGFGKDATDTGKAISHFRSIFFELSHPARTEKHVSEPSRNSAAKRINMYLRWMIRQDEMGVDFGLWKIISPSKLCCPLDLHSGSVARKLGLLERKQDDWKAVCELTGNLRRFDPSDPVKYDLALFSLGVYEHF
ncbi:MAG: TIGR02757 family protein [Bacteroidota bacterium]